VQFVSILEIVYSIYFKTYHNPLAELDGCNYIFLWSVILQYEVVIFIFNNIYMIGNLFSSWHMVFPAIGFWSIWSLAWKGLALWHAAHRKEKWWFIALLLLETVGILEIIYLFGIVKIQQDKTISHGKNIHHT